MDNGYRITSAVGTSAGALVASLVAAGYGSSALREIVQRMPWSRLWDRRLIARLPFLGPHVNVSCTVPSIVAGGITGSRPRPAAITPPRRRHLR
jgi:predicted acylesterase/phospholipase RssA